VGNKRKKYITESLGYEIVSDYEFSGRHSYAKVIRKEGKFGFYASKQNIIHPMYDDIGRCVFDTIAVKKDGKWGFVRVKDTWIWSEDVFEAISPIYDEAEDFSGFFNSKALVTLNGEKFYINRNGERYKNNI